MSAKRFTYIKKKYMNRTRINYEVNVKKNKYNN